jgi:hypothetical protein
MRTPQYALSLLAGLWFAAGAGQSLDHAADVFARYESALNGHDAEAVAAFWALDRSSGEAMAKSRRVLARWKGYREFEAASHARFTIAAKALGGDTYEVVQREDCDFYRWLGSGTRTSRFTVHVREGRFHDVVSGPDSDSGRDYAEALDDFRTWLLAHHAAQAALVLRDGEFVFDARSAGILLPLAGQWDAQAAGPE